MRSNGQTLVRPPFFPPPSLQPRNWCFLFLGGLFYFRSAAQPVFEVLPQRITTVAYLARSAMHVAGLHAQNKRSEFQSVARLPDYPAAARVSSTSWRCLYRGSFELLFSHRHIAFALVQPSAANPNVHVLNGYDNCNYADRNILFPIII
jgi:hypothetical protein